MSAFLQLPLAEEEEFYNAELRIYHLNGHSRKTAMPTSWFNPHTTCIAGL